MPLSLLGESISYNVLFEGTVEKQLLKEMKKASSCYQGAKKKADSLHTIKQRALSDIEKLMRVAKYYGYYSCKISYHLSEDPATTAIFTIDTGPLYHIASYDIVEDGKSLASVCPLTIGDAATTQAIFDAERSIVWGFKKEGYALCRMLHKGVFADARSASVHVNFSISRGPIVNFGKLLVEGNTSIKQATIAKYLVWHEGELYDPQKVEEAQKALEKSGFFSSVTINPNESQISDGKIPMTVSVQEGKLRSIGAGIAYATWYGPGIRAEWEHRNFWSSGNKFSFRTEIWKKYQTVLFSLTQPNFKNASQTLIWLLEYGKLRNVAFNSISYTGTALVQQRIDEKMETSLGVSSQWLHAHNYQGSKRYYLAKVPIQVKWSSTNSLLDPTKGISVNVKITPTAQILIPHFGYASQTSSFATYFSNANERFTLACKVTFGNIIGASRHSIPAPDRFYGGSENVLRGYKAFTVSPLHHHKIPKGGRSLLVANVEGRLRTEGNLGWVVFYDIGNVY